MDVYGKSKRAHLYAETFHLQIHERKRVLYIYNNFQFPHFNELG